jgi:hypothetical protein
MPPKCKDVANEEKSHGEWRTPRFEGFSTLWADLPSLIGKTKQTKVSLLKVFYTPFAAPESP